MTIEWIILYCGMAAVIIGEFGKNTLCYLIGIFGILCIILSIIICMSGVIK